MASLKVAMMPAMMPKRTKNQPEVTNASSPAFGDGSEMQAAKDQDVTSLVICREFGPFSEEDEVERFRKLIGVGGDLFERQVKKSVTHWSVLINSSSSGDDYIPSAELLSFLEQQGLFMSRIGMKDESAIGPFVSEKVAQSYKRGLQGLNIATNVSSADAEGVEYWLRSEFETVKLPVVTATLSGYLSGSQVEGVAQVVCN